MILNGLVTTLICLTKQYSRDGYRKVGQLLRGSVVSARIWGIEVHTLADYAALFTVHWGLRRGDQSIEREYRICYSLIRV